MPKHFVSIVMFQQQIGDMYLLFRVFVHDVKLREVELSLQIYKYTNIESEE